MRQYLEGLSDRIRFPAPRIAFPTGEPYGQPRPFGLKSGGIERQFYVYSTPNRAAQSRERARRYYRFFAPAPGAGHPKKDILRPVPGLFLVKKCIL